MRPSQLLATALTLASLSAAWPWPEALQDTKAPRDIEGVLFRRQDSSSSTGSTQASATASASNSASAGASATDSASAPTSTDGSATTTASSSGSQRTAATTARSGVTSRPTGNSTKTIAFDPRLPAGGISMITPAALSGAQYYKIGDWVTFGWNYTSLSVTPSAIDILASCSANQATYTLALNQTVEPTGRVLWDTGAYQKTATVPLLTQTYTLIIYDAAEPAGVSATPRAGYLGAFNQYTFGMYSPQPYRGLAEYQCATCKSGAMSAMERQTLGFLLGMSAITVLSFTWFAGGLGLF